MSSIHLVDQELLPAIELSTPPPLSSEILPMVRAGMLEGLSPVKDAIANNPYVEEIFFPSRLDQEPIRALIYRPQETYDTARPAIVSLHGGGFVLGAPEIDHAIQLRYADELGCVVIAIDYRLAPDFPHPTPVEDCYSGLEWLHANATTLNVDTSRIAVVGESAGGGLAACLTLLARDRGELNIAYQALLVPCLDEQTVARCEASLPNYAGEFIWTLDNHRFAWASLLNADPSDSGTSAYAAAARAEDLSGLPPTFISAAALDLLLDEDILYAQRLIRVGVPTELHVYPKTIHGFTIMSEARVTKKHNADLLEALRRGLDL